MARWTIKFASQPDADYEYEITPGWTEVSTWSEELDSASIAFGQVDEANRLVDLKPYEFCRIFDRENGTSREWLVDSFQEDEIDTIKHLYRYQLTLMSETKLLEKVQLPNIAITHSLTESNPTIEDKIDSLLTRYVPWVVSGTADSPTAVQLITRGTETIDGLDEECKEINLNAPTLREAITTLTTQIGALPVVENRELNFLDLREAGNTDFNEVGITSVSRSNSSDAFTTAIDTQTDRMIDQTGSGVRTEITTFRNPDGAVLKLNGNAVLPVDFPIYTIQKVLASTYGWVRPLSGSGNFPLKGANAFYYALPSDSMKNGINGTAESTSVTSIQLFLKPSIVSRNSSGSASSSVEWTLTIGQSLRVYVQALHCENMTYEPLYSTSDGWMSYTAVVQSDNSVSFNFSQPAGTTDFVFYAFPSYTSGSSTQTFLGLWGTQHSLFPTTGVAGNTGTYQAGGAIRFNKALIIEPCIDLTELFKENSERQLLSTDWNDFYTWTGSSTFNGLSIDTLATYYYSTIGYSIGDSEISGWSDTFNDTVWWWDNERTVGEIIYEWFMNAYSDELLDKLEDEFDPSDFIEMIIEDGHLPDDLAEVLRNPPLSGSIVSGDGSDTCWGYLQFSTDKSDYSFGLDSGDGNWDNIGDGYEDLTDASYLNMIFSITYQPISIVNIQSFKDRDEEGAFRIQNYDTPSDAYANFDDFMTAERDKVNRLGEDIVLINQRVRDESLIQDVGTRFRDDYIVYKREVAHWQGFSTAQYYASRDAVAKNFSTALQRKYRAYENVDYSQSVRRLENRTIFVYLYTSEYSPAEPPTGIRQLARVRVNHPSALIYGTSEPLRKGVEGGQGAAQAWTGLETLYQFDLATMSYTDGIAVAMMERDNATFGAQLRIAEYNEMIGDGVGGVPQQWVEFPSNFRTQHFIGYITALDSWRNLSASVGYDYPELPYTFLEFIEEESSDYAVWTRTFDYSISEAFVEVDQDLSEVCGFTTQFELWWGEGTDDTEYFRHSEHFAEYLPWIQSPSDPPNIYWRLVNNSDIDTASYSYRWHGEEEYSASYTTGTAGGGNDRTIYPIWGTYSGNANTRSGDYPDEGRGYMGPNNQAIWQERYNYWAILTAETTSGNYVDILAFRVHDRDSGTLRNPIQCLNVQLTEFKTKRRMTEDSEGYIRFDEDTD